VAGDKKHRRSISSYFADKGWFVFNINYRLSPYYAFPSPNIDCMKALNYLKQMEEKYNLDLDKVVVTGDSAGAYFAAYLVAASNNQKLRNTLEIPDPEVKIAGFMGFCGPYDIALSLESKLPFGLTRDIAGCFLGFEIKSDFSNLKEFPYYDQLSPINFVDKNWRPSFIAYAEKDIFCKGQGEYLKQQLEKLNIPVFSHNSMKLMDNHCYHLDMFKAISKDCLIEAVKFLDFIKGLK
jgi:acetyl esterase/lipase